MDKIKENIKEDLDKVETKLKDVVLAENTVYNELKNFLCSNSKRIRSVLVILYLKMNCKTISDDIILLITAGEIIHNASLLHDDIIDNAETRRGKLTIGKKFAPNISILTGDYLLSEAVKIISEINNKKITDIILNCTKKMADAEINQYILRGSIPTSAQYLSICEGKTAGLFEAMLKCAAILSNIDDKDAEFFGKKFGILFQIKNDISENSLKNDKLNNTHTAYDIFGIEKTHNLIDNYIEEMRSILNKFPDNIYKQNIKDLTEKL